MRLTLYLLPVTILAVCSWNRAQAETDVKVSLTWHDDSNLLQRLLTNSLAVDPEPPTSDKDAKAARFISHFTSWGSLSHISRQPGISGMPMARVYCISDGPNNETTGVPYLFLTPEDEEVQDLLKDPRASLTMSLAQTPYCQVKNYNPEDPRCPQVILTGKVIFLKNDTEEYKYAREAIFTRHKDMRFWPKIHFWYTCKLQIERILLVDDFGGNKYPSLDLYYKSNPELPPETNDSPYVDNFGGNNYYPGQNLYYKANPEFPPETNELPLVDELGGNMYLNLDLYYKTNPELPSETNDIPYVPV